MEQSREAARQKQWDDALKQAVRALHEFPQDTDARSSAAVALFYTGKHPKALQVFEELRGNDPNNPFVLEYIARINEQMGNRLAAVGAYGQLADVQQSRKLIAKAVEALREVLRLQPTADDQRLRLARMLEEAGNPTGAAAEYVMLAQRAQEHGDLDEANAHAEAAQRLDPQNGEIQEYVTTLHAALAKAAQATITGGGALDPQIPTAGMTGALRSQQFAAEKLIELAEERQRAGDELGAIEQYERAITLGAERNDMFYNLGVLYQSQEEHQKAVTMLQRVVSDSEYALSAHYALGTSYQALGQLPQAAQEYEQTIRLVDLQTIGKAESEDLIQMYESAAKIYAELNDIARAASLYSTLASFLQTKRWGKDRAEEFRVRAKELTQRNMFAKLRSLGTGALTLPEPAPQPMPPPQETLPETWGKIRPITDFLKPARSAESSSADVFGVITKPAFEEPKAVLDVLEALPEAKPDLKPLTTLDTSGLDDVCVKYVQAGEKYVEQGLIEAALDACLEVIRLAPDYLPIHLRMGEIYEREGRTEDALVKYQLLVEVFRLRNEPRHAIDVYYRLIELSPDTINPRLRLAELLKEDNRADAAAEQIGIVASSYLRMGQTNKAIEEYRRGLQWAPNSAFLHAQYGHALLRLERYEAALGEFRRALDLEQHSLPAIARMNATLALMNDQPNDVWQSLATILDRLKAQPQQMADVQAEYRTILMAADDPILHYILGIIHQSANQHPSALLEFEQALELLDHDDHPLLPVVLVHQAMADSHIALSQANEALEQLQKGQAVANNVGNRLASSHRYPFSTPLTQGELVRRMAEAYGASGDMEGAEQALQQAKQHLPYDRAIYTKLADIYFRQGKLNEALAQLDELATYYEGRQDLDRSIEMLEYGLKLAPNNIPLGSRLAQMLLRRGYLDKGVENLLQVAEQQRRAGQLKDAVASLQQAADVHWTLGQHDQARTIYDKIIKIAPNDVEARQWLSFMYTLSGQTRQAITEKKQLARIFLQQRDYEGATAELFTIIALDQHDIDAFYQLGDVLMRREEYEQAVRIYGRLAKMPNIEVDRVEALQAAAKRMLDQQQTRAKSPS
jgi:tetratricopeptide (TPR) repeat protein